VSQYWDAYGKQHEGLDLRLIEQQPGAVSAEAEY
jgi:hypothetical protein